VLVPSVRLIVVDLVAHDLVVVDLPGPGERGDVAALPFAELLEPEAPRAHLTLGEDSESSHGTRARDARARAGLGLVHRDGIGLREDHEAEAGDHRARPEGDGRKQHVGRGGEGQHVDREEQQTGRTRRGQVRLSAGPGPWPGIGRTRPRTRARGLADPGPQFGLDCGPPA